MGDEIDCDYEYTETDPISPAELAAGSGAQLNTMFAFHEVIFAGRPAPRSASHLSLSCHVVNVRQIPSAPLELTSEAQTQCNARFQDVGPDRLAVHRNSVASCTAPLSGRGGSAKLGCRVLRRHHCVLAHA